MQLSELRKKGFNFLGLVLVDVWVVLLYHQGQGLFLIRSPHQSGLDVCGSHQVPLSGLIRNFNIREKKQCTLGLYKFEHRMACIRGLLTGLKAA